MKVRELKEALLNMDNDLEVVIPSGGEDGYGHSPVESVTVEKAVYDPKDNLDGPYRMEDHGDKLVVRIDY